MPDSQMEVFYLTINGCKHYANAYDMEGAIELAKWCHFERGYCYYQTEAGK